MQTAGQRLELHLSRCHKSLGATYVVIRDGCIKLQERWCARWPEGNDHGPRHVARVLDNLAQLMGPTPVSKKLVNELELAIAMTAVIAHDIGMVDGRSDHAERSATIVKEIAGKNPLLFDEHALSTLVLAIKCHSSQADIVTEGAHLQPERMIGPYLVRVQLIAALVRLADELDEDHRRADDLSEEYSNVPPTSQAYWRFCRCVSGIKIGVPGGDIRVDCRLATSELQGSSSNEPKTENFLEFFSKKLAKMNRERARMAMFLGSGFARTRLSIVIEPPQDAARFVRIKQFDFNDSHAMDDEAELQAAAQLVATLRLPPSVSIIKQRHDHGATQLETGSGHHVSEHPTPAGSYEAVELVAELKRRKIVEFSYLAATGGDGVDLSGNVPIESLTVPIQISVSIIDGAVTISVRYSASAQKAGIEAVVTAISRRTRLPIVLKKSHAIISQGLSGAQRTRPLISGLSIGSGLLVGTIAAFVQEELRVPKTVYILASGDVLSDRGRLSSGCPVFQPAPADGGNLSDVIGSLARYIAPGPAVNRIDAGLVLPTSSAMIEEGHNIANGIDITPRGVVANVEQLLGRAVIKIGRTTGITQGTIVDISADISVSYGNTQRLFEDQIGIKSLHKNEPFSQSGDSGALVLDAQTHEAVGMVLGASRDLTFASPISMILSHLGVRLLGL